MSFKLNRCLYTLTKTGCKPIPGYGHASAFCSCSQAVRGVSHQGLRKVTRKKKKKLILVNPVNLKRAGFSDSHSSRFPPLSLGLVAALTPADWDVEVG